MNICTELSEIVEFSLLSKYKIKFDFSSYFTRYLPFASVKMNIALNETNFEISSLKCFIYLLEDHLKQSSTIPPHLTKNSNDTATLSRTLTNQSDSRESNLNSNNDKIDSTPQQITFINKKGTQYQYHAWKSYYEPKHLSTYIKQVEISPSKNLKIEATDVKTSEMSLNVLSDSMTLANNKENINAVEKSSKSSADENSDINGNKNESLLMEIARETKQVDNSQVNNHEKNTPIEPSFKLPKNFLRPKSKYKKHIFQNAIAIYVS